jgi:hypothetical protein
MMDIKPPVFNPTADLSALARSYLANPAAAAGDLGASIRAAMGLVGPTGMLVPPAMGGMNPDMDDYSSFFAEPNRPDE